MKSCLIVDDSKVVRIMARRIVEDMNFAVDKAEDGQVALDHCQRQMPDVILLDWKHAGHERHRFSAGAAPVGLRRPAGGRAMYHGERYPADSLGD